MVQKVKEVRTDKDARKERMSADTKTTYGAPPKKNGQGGAYTWYVALLKSKKVTVITVNSIKLVYRVYR